MCAARWTFSQLIEDFDSASNDEEVVQMRWVRGKSSSCAVLLDVDVAAFTVALPSEMVRPLISGTGALQRDAGILSVEQRFCRLVADDGEPGETTRRPSGL